MTRHIIGGSAFGFNDALIDAEGAVLLDNVTVVAVTTGRQGKIDDVLSFGLELEGRINKSAARSSVLYLTEADGLAAIVTEIMGLAHRAGIADEVWALISERMDAMPKAPEADA